MISLFIGMSLAETQGSLHIQKNFTCFNILLSDGNNTLGKEAENMKEDKANPSIECSVQQCDYHCQNQDYCSLDRIKVGTHESSPTQTECTDCESFKVRTTM